MTRTALVASSPIVAHTLNATPVVRALVGVGVRVVWYVAPSLAAHARRFTDDVVVMNDGVAGLAAHDPESRGVVGSLAGVRRLYRDALVAPVDDQLPALRELTVGHDVDMVVSDTLMLAAGLVAETLELPWATIGDGPLQWPHPDVPPFGTGLPLMPGPAGRHRNRNVKRAIDAVLFSQALGDLNRVRHRLGLWPSADLLTAGVSRQLHLQGCVPSFEHPRTPWPEHVHFVGALGPGPGAAAPVPERLRRHRRGNQLALISQGTRRDDPRELVDPAVDVLLAEGFDVLVAGVAPGRVQHPRIHPMARVDYHDAMAEADLFVTNGGYTGVTLALATGTPVVQCGATEEKADIGRRLVATGAGESLPLVRPPRWLLRRAVRRCLADPQRRRARLRIAEEFSAYPTDRLLAGHLLALLEGNCDD